MRVGIIGTGAIANKHAQAYKNIGFELVVCSNTNPETGRRFAAAHGTEFVESFEAVCRHPKVDFVDVCTFPEFRLPAVEECAKSGKHIQVQKPIATNLSVARQMIHIAASAGIQLNVVSQHRFDEACLFLSEAIPAGRLGKILQADCYVKWYRFQEYYSRSVKGSWQAEGGGALINQAIHQVDLLRWLAGPIQEVFGFWQLGATHKIESEDVVSATIRYAGGATGIIQASTSIWPGYPEKIEFHGSHGTAVITGDRLTTWDVLADQGATPPLAVNAQSGASDPMAISLRPFELQFLDFADAIANNRPPLVSGEEGYRSLAVVEAIYQSCRTGERVRVEQLSVPLQKHSSTPFFD